MQAFLGVLVACFKSRLAETAGVGNRPNAADSDGKSADRATVQDTWSSVAPERRGGLSDAQAMTTA
ncbi:hypothetical protein ACFOWB_11265 [Chenggangzhangella methanolivorans]|uniref:hypothetical protein n=1 Tax=Chenggangzhangella methanolivorans TaxID=1437009 RepID=UPI003618DE9A